MARGARADGSNDRVEPPSAAKAGEPRAADELLPLLYDELRELARARLRGAERGATLQATALVHEAYLRLVGDRDPGWNGRGHFFGAAARAMRRIVVERAREKASLKRGGARASVDFEQVATLGDGDSTEVLALDEALARLAAQHERKARVVELRYFAGLTLEEAAAALEISLATAKTDWSFARAWLHRALASGGR
jgi:RNA polymerase sigma factor (TIGR02999 family)